eukprot:scaffold3680_cov133-Isochrysis_galbana.AAC.4
MATEDKLLATTSALYTPLGEEEEGRARMPDADATQKRKTETETVRRWKIRSSARAANSSAVLNSGVISASWPSTGVEKGSRGSHPKSIVSVSGLARGSRGISESPNLPLS